MFNNFLGSTVQIYTTWRCGMQCPHCSSRLQVMSDMTLLTFQSVVKTLWSIGVQRIELFANDPLLHPQIKQQIRILNKSGLGYALLTVGDGPENPCISQLFSEVVFMIDKQKGGIVFSVDYTESTAKGILSAASKSLAISYAFKAKVFWESAQRFQAEAIPVRTNTVISRNNADEVIPIMRTVAEMGFGASCCFVQHAQPKFHDVFSGGGLTLELEQGFRKYMNEADLLDIGEIDTIIVKTHRIVEKNGWSTFNKFRGSDSSEGEIPEKQLKCLRNSLLELKIAFPDKILPSESFLDKIGSHGFGCIELLKCSRFPQMKIGTEGQMIFCCDLHDPITSGYSICDIKKRKDFLKVIRTNPYIWICMYFNPCDFSVNHVTFSAIAT